MKTTQISFGKLPVGSFFLVEELGWLVKTSTRLACLPDRGCFGTYRFTFADKVICVA